MSNRISAMPPSSRIASIDALRGLTILTMIFVNDIASVESAPDWMKHMPGGADGMTFVDVVFPAFLFLVGMSIPFALGRRLERGVGMAEVFGHVCLRTLGLLIIGVYMVNTETMQNSESWLSSLWKLVMYLSVMMIWNEIPRESDSKRRSALAYRIVGIVLLVVLAFLYRNPDIDSWMEMRTSWWGILGLIGWAYLVASTIYILLRNQPFGLMGMISLLYYVYMAGQTGFFDGVPFLIDYVDIGGMLGSHPAITLSGVLLGMILLSDSPARTHGARLRWAVGYGLGLAAAGWMLHSLKDIHPMFIVDKNAATPPWCLLCSAITIGVWVVIYWIMDVRGWTGWASVLAPAGQSPLFAYILVPIFYSLLPLLGLAGIYDRLGENFSLGFVRALALTFAASHLTGYLYRKGLRLRL